MPPRRRARSTNRAEWLMTQRAEQEEREKPQETITNSIGEQVPCRHMSTQVYWHELPGLEKEQADEGAAEDDDIDVDVFDRAIRPSIAASILAAAQLLSTSSTNTTNQQRRQQTQPASQQQQSQTMMLLTNSSAGSQQDQQLRVREQEEAHKKNVERQIQQLKQRTQRKLVPAREMTPLTVINTVLRHLGTGYVASAAAFKHECEKAASEVAEQLQQQSTQQQQLNRPVTKSGRKANEKSSQHQGLFLTQQSQTQQQTQNLTQQSVAVMPLLALVTEPPLCTVVSSLLHRISDKMMQLTRGRLGLALQKLPNAAALPLGVSRVTVGNYVHAGTRAIFVFDMHTPRMAAIVGGTSYRMRDTALGGNLVVMVPIADPVPYVLRKRKLRLPFAECTVLVVDKKTTPQQQQQLQQPAQEQQQQQQQKRKGTTAAEEEAAKKAAQKKHAKERRDLLRRTGGGHDDDDGDSSSTSSGDDGDGDDDKKKQQRRRGGAFTSMTKDGALDIIFNDMVDGESDLSGDDDDDDDYDSDGSSGDDDDDDDSLFATATNGCPVEDTSAEDASSLPRVDVRGARQQHRKFGAKSAWHLRFVKNEKDRTSLRDAVNKTMTQTQGGAFGASQLSYGGGGSLTASGGPGAGGSMMQLHDDDDDPFLM